MGSIINFHIHISFDSLVVKQGLYVFSPSRQASVFPINHFPNIKLKTLVPWKT